MSALPDRLRAFPCLMVMLGAMAGCGQGASLVRDTSTGGVVSYAIQSESDILTSDGRRDAMDIIRKKCPNGSRIVKEGAIPKVSNAADRAWRGQMGTDRLWGIQFTCE
jgi:hypothetical protein